MHPYLAECNHGIQSIVSVFQNKFDFGTEYLVAYIASQPANGSCSSDHSRTLLGISALHSRPYLSVGARNQMSVPTSYEITVFASSDHEVLSQQTHIYSQCWICEKLILRDYEMIFRGESLCVESEEIFSRPKQHLSL